MGILVNFFGTTVGKKITMALTGLVLVGFVTGHMLGNLKMFGGIDPELGIYKLDAYAIHLREIGAAYFGHMGFLWVVRLVLLACLILHVVSAIQLARINRRARPVGYREQKYKAANPASRSMLFGGLFLLAFIIFHILHLTTGQTHPSFEEGQAYANVYRGFQQVPVTVFYLLAMGFLCAHLYHGVWSMFQTIGADTPTWNPGLRTLAKALAILLFLGFSSVPVASVLKLVPAPLAVTAMASEEHK